MKAADVMARNVITVGPDACVQDVAHTLLTARISGVPVVGPNGELVGIVSEGDLMRVEAGTGRRRPWWLAIFTGKEALAMEFIREHSRKVADVMTREVITAAPDTPLWKVANLLEKNAIKRVELATGADDSQIRDKVLTQLNAEPWTRPLLINVIVQDGTVELWGIVESAGEESCPHRRRGHPRRARR